MIPCSHCPQPLVCVKPGKKCLHELHRVVTVRRSSGGSPKIVAEGQSLDDAQKLFLAMVEDRDVVECNIITHSGLALMGYAHRTLEEARALRDNGPPH